MRGFFRRVKAGQKPGFAPFKPVTRFQCLDIAEPSPRMVKRHGRYGVVKIKGCPRIKMRPTRPLPDSSQLKSLRIVRRPTGCTVDLGYEVEKAPLPSNHQSIGVDMGVRKRLTLSTGETVEQNTPLREKIATQQRASARGQKGAKGQQKKVRQLARLRRQQVQNRNACHRLTTDLVRRFGMIAVEKLEIQQMTRKGTGKKHLNRSVSEQTWGLIRQQLAYKAAWAGREFVAVAPAFTSQDCSRCGARHDLGSGEQYRCPSCGLRLDRDENAAMNILRAGTIALAARQKCMPDPVGLSL